MGHEEGLAAPEEGLAGWEVGACPPGVGVERTKNNPFMGGVVGRVQP